MPRSMKLCSTKITLCIILYKLYIYNILQMLHGFFHCFTNRNDSWNKPIAVMSVVDRHCMVRTEKIFQSIVVEMNNIIFPWFEQLPGSRW